jgi:diguanylate cyclase (GGDEF)-like protein
MPERQREDEIGELAQSFERMRVNVAEHREQILRLAYEDGLTGLANRTKFRDAIHDALNDEPGSRPLAVLMIDLDRFKRVNDVLGYETGDRLLVRIAQRLQQCAAGEGRLLARLGGDEFGLLVPGADAALAAAIAHRVAEAVDAPFQVDDHRIDMGAGIGIACWPGHAANADALLVRAEMAVVAAKRKGSGPQVYDPSLDVTSAQSLTLMTELRRAVEQGELRLFLQPKLALEDRRVVGAEALVRWMHPTRGLVPPLHFIPFAEQSGFIRTLTQWVFEEAARQWKALTDEASDFVLSVNLSTRDLTDPELPQKFAAALGRHRVPPSALCLEITESAIMDDPQRALATLDTLASMGFKLSIDDFGTGYSSLAYLKRLPVDELKIDQSFVRQMQADTDDAMIVRSTIDLAHNLGLTVVAEGVETEAAWTMLRELRCDNAQGYHMARPMPIDDFARWMLAASAAPMALEAEGASLLH